MKDVVTIKNRIMLLLLDLDMVGGKVGLTPVCPQGHTDLLHDGDTLQSSNDIHIR